MGFLPFGWPSGQKECSSFEFFLFFFFPTFQFTVLRDGQRQKIIYEKNQPLSYISTIEIPQLCCQRRAAKESPHGSADPEQCNELHCEEGHLERKRAFSSGSASSSGKNHIKNPCYYNSVIKGNLKSDLFAYSHASQFVLGLFALFQYGFAQPMDTSS